MTESTKRDQWTEHLKDEATAHQDQQSAAGTTHFPVQGPLPYSADNLDEARKQAVLQEREACAAIAESWSSEARLLAAFPQLGEAERRAALEVAAAIARDIRSA